MTFRWIICVKYQKTTDWSLATNLNYHSNYKNAKYWFPLISLEGTEELFFDLCVCASFLFCFFGFLINATADFFWLRSHWTEPFDLWVILISLGQLPLTLLGEKSFSVLGISLIEFWLTRPLSQIMLSFFPSRRSDREKQTGVRKGEKALSPDSEETGWRILQ